MGVLAFIRRQYERVLTRSGGVRSSDSGAAAPVHLCDFGHAVSPENRLCSYGHRAAKTRS